MGIARLRLGRSLLRQGRYDEAARESQSGYEIVKKQTEPSAGWIKNACTDLIAACEALGRSEEAARYRAELDRLEAPDPATDKPK